MPRYIGLPVEKNVEDLTALMYDYLRAKAPGWVANSGNLEVWLGEASALWAADLMSSLSEMADNLYMYFGSSLIGIPPIIATPATVTVTITVKDNLGYTLPAGSTVGFTTGQGELFTFQTATQLVITAGTNDGDVTLVATEAGSASSNLGGAGQAMEMVDPIDWVVSVVMQTATTAGVDAETSDDYMDRLTTQLRLLSPRPILPADFAAMALNISGNARALAIDGYDPVTDTFDNARMVALATLDASGNTQGAAIKNQTQLYLESLRETTFVVNMIDATVTPVDVTFAVAMLPGRTASLVNAAVVVALQQYLSSQNWGVSESALGNWSPQPNVRLYELSTVINQVDGVDYITDLTVGINGGTQDDRDLSLPGVAPLATPGAIIGTVS